MNLKLIGAVGATILLSATTASAAVTFYSDFASFSAAVPAYETITIPDVGTGTSGGGYDAFGEGDASVTYDSINFSQSASLGNADFFNISSLFSGVRAVVSSQSATVGVENILITLPSPVTAFAFDYGTFEGSDVTFTLSDGSTTTLGSAGSVYGTPDFFGVTDSSGITSVLITSPDAVLNVNGVVATIPEPPTWAMMLLGFAGLGLAGYRSRKAPSIAAFDCAAESSGRA
jgi:hypothetical protein